MQYVIYAIQFFLVAHGLQIVATEISELHMDYKWVAYATDDIIWARINLTLTRLSPSYLKIAEFD